MLLVLFFCVLIWGGGALINLPKRLRWGFVFGLIGVVILMHVTLADGHPLRLQTGETAAPWFMLLGAGVLIFAYRSGVRSLRARAMQQAPEPENTKTFSEAELNRYARHMVLREIGGVGQKKLKNAKILVIGAGGLGSPALMYLAAAGVGTIGVIDDDVVENSNLQRQVIHRDADIGIPKVFSAQKAMVAQNPYVDVRPYHRKLTEADAIELFQDYDFVLDGTDNFDTRYAVNAAAVATKTLLISGALSQWEGQVSVFDPAQNAPCYACVFPSPPAPELAPGCAAAGVVGPLPGVIGAMMATEVIKLITGAGAPLRGEMLIYDVAYAETRKISLKRRHDCAVCGGADR